jgi:hypothetical protein
VVDPLTGALGTTAGAGMAPSVIRVSDDGTLLYAGSTTSTSIQRFRLPGLASDITIPLGSLPPGGPGSPIATQTLEVKPGAAHTIAVSRFDPTISVSMDVAIFDDATVRGLPRTSTPPNDPFQITWSSDGTTVYGADVGVSPPSIGTYDVTSTGATYRSGVNGISPGNLGISFLDGKLYMSSGIVLDPATRNALATVSASGATVVDVDDGILFVVQSDFAHGSTLLAYDLAHFVPIGKWAIDVLPFAYPQVTVKRAVRFGSDGLAMVTSAGDLVVVEHVLTLPDPALGGSGQLLHSMVGSTSYAVYDLPANSLAWSATQNLLYISLPSSAAGRGNSIAAFDPNTGAIAASAFVGAPGPQRRRHGALCRVGWRERSRAGVGAGACGRADAAARGRFLPRGQLSIDGRARTRQQLDTRGGEGHKQWLEFVDRRVRRCHHAHRNRIGRFRLRRPVGWRCVDALPSWWLRLAVRRTVGRGCGRRVALDG